MKGQEVSHEFDIPPHTPKLKQKSESPAGRVNKKSSRGSLIDVGGESPRPKSTGVDSLRGDDKSENAQNAQSPQQASSQSTSGTAQPLQPTATSGNQNSVERLDSKTNEVDKFVDAED